MKILSHGISTSCLLYLVICKRYKYSGGIKCQIQMSERKVVKFPQPAIGTAPGVSLCMRQARHEAWRLARQGEGQWPFREIAGSGPGPVLSTTSSRLQDGKQRVIALKSTVLK